MDTSFWIIEFSISAKDRIGVREGRTLDECRDPWLILAVRLFDVAVGEEIRRL